jgi:hypothetical protein
MDGVKATTTRTFSWSGFTSAGWRDPTMTILALSMRVSEYLAGEISKKNI